MGKLFVKSGGAKALPQIIEKTRAVRTGKIAVPGSAPSPVASPAPTTDASAPPSATIAGGDGGEAETQERRRRLVQRTSSAASMAEKLGG